MTSTILISSICALVAIMGLTFTVFWKIIDNATKALHKRIDTLRTDEKSKEKNISYLQTELRERPTFKYCDDTYTRFREHSIEYNALNEKLDKVITDIEELKKCINGKKGG